MINFNNMQEAMSYAKHSPVAENSIVPVSTPRPIAVTTYRPAFYSTTTTTPTPASVSYVHPFVKNVIIRPHSEPHHHYDPLDLHYIPPYDFNNDLVNDHLIHSTPRTPALSFEPPKSDVAIIASTTPSPLPVVSNPTHAPIKKYTEQQFSTTVRPLLDDYSTNELDRSDPIHRISHVDSSTYRPHAHMLKLLSSYTPRYDITPISASSARPLIASESINKPYYSKDFQAYAPLNYNKNDVIDSHHYRKVSDNYNEAYEPLTNRDGFKYFLPRQYHEEEGSSDTRDGSFGYIDPFGIRRVIYYNVRPGSGFNHRKNNRYVGFNATPYDPRPSIQKK